MVPSLTMKTELHIIARQTLVNDFVNIVFQSEALNNVKPGHYFECEDNAAKIYLMKTSSQQAEAIVSSKDLFLFNQETIVINDFREKIYEPPHPEKFTILISGIETLMACLYYLKQYRQPFKGIVFISGEGPFPFHPIPSQIVVPTLPSYLIATLPLLEDWGITTRLANTQDMPGCFCGKSEQLIQLWNKEAGKLPMEYHLLNF